MKSQDWVSAPVYNLPLPLTCGKLFHTGGCFFICRRNLAPVRLAPGASRALERQVCSANHVSWCPGELVFSPEVWHVISPTVSSLSVMPPLPGVLTPRPRCCVLRPREAGWSLLLKSKGGSGWRAGPGEVFRSRAGQTARGSGFPGRDTVPPEQGTVCGAAVSTEPGSASGSTPQGGQECDRHTVLCFYWEETEAQEACGSKKL